MNDKVAQMKFERWMKQVDVQLFRQSYGAISSTLDLADQCYRDQFDSGTTPAEMARMALEDEGFPFPD